MNENSCNCILIRQENVLNYFNCTTSFWKLFALRVPPFPSPWVYNFVGFFCGFVLGGGIFYFVWLGLFLFCCYFFLTLTLTIWGIALSKLPGEWHNCVHFYFFITKRVWFLYGLCEPTEILVRFFVCLFLRQVPFSLSKQFWSIWKTTCDAWFC